MTTATETSCSDCRVPLSKNMIKLGHVRCEPCHEIYVKSWRDREDERWKVWWRIAERKMGLR